MSIHQHPARSPLVPASPPGWGEVTPEHASSPSVRFVLADRSVTFPTGMLQRWEHVAGNPETLVILAGGEEITIEGRHLGEIRQALDDTRLRELRVGGSKISSQAGPWVRRITMSSL